MMKMKSFYHQIKKQESRFHELDWSQVDKFCTAVASAISNPAHTPRTMYSWVPYPKIQYATFTNNQADFERFKHLLSPPELPASKSGKYILYWFLYKFLDVVLATNNSIHDTSLDIGVFISH